MKKAMLFEKVRDEAVHCFLCNHHCRIKDGEFGFCGVRENIEGVLYAHSYGQLITAHTDPIEKKPLYHFHPGTKSFSVATNGCNFRCDFCQNWQISQASHREGTAGSMRETAPEEIVHSAVQQDCRSISYTYTEPTIFFEYAFDTARLAKEKGLDNVFVTNGFMTEDALETIQPYLDACNVDLKSFSEEFYEQRCGARLKPVLKSIAAMRRLDLWVEVTTLVVPGQNDSADELSQIAGFIAGIDPDIPWHISRFHPDYQFRDGGPTPISTLETARSKGREAGLRYVYVGNVQGVSTDTLCPQCGETVVTRGPFEVLADKVRDGACTRCGAPIAGVFDSH